MNKHLHKSECKEEITGTCSVRAFPWFEDDLLDNDYKHDEQPHKIKEDKSETNKRSGSYIYGFDKIITFEGNMIAVKAAKKVARNPQKIYNPLYIYGEPGTGKTHILKAIEGAIIQDYPDMSVMYVTADKFCNDMIDASKSVNSWAMSEIRDIYRTQDVLIIDDVQKFAGRFIEMTELSNVIDALISNGNQLVFAADKPPKKLDVFERLKTQMRSGLIAELKVPDIDTKQNIIRLKAEENEVLLSKEVVDYISKNVGTNVCEIEGAVTCIEAYLELYRPSVSLDMAKEILKDLIEPEC